MREVDIEELIDNVDICFNEYAETPENVDMIFYQKSFDGSEYHEIHDVYIVSHDSQDVTKPYIIEYYNKEYMWNDIISFDQEDCILLSIVSKERLSGVLEYLREKDIIDTYFTYGSPDKNPLFIPDRSISQQVIYTISVVWSNDILGDYTDLIEYTLDLHSIDMDNFNNIQSHIIAYCKHKIDILYNNPSFILNKMARDHIGPFVIHPSTLSQRYKYWEVESEVGYSSDEDVPDVVNSSNEVHSEIQDTNTQYSQYSLDRIRLDICQKDEHAQYCNNELIYIKDLSENCDTVNVYSHTFDINNKIWRFNNNLQYKMEKYDKYWSVYENSLYDPNEIHALYTSRINTILKEYIKNTPIISSQPEEPGESDDSYTSYLKCIIH